MSTVEDKRRIITVFEKILAGDHPYYRNRLHDEAFVLSVAAALTSERESLQDILKKGEVS